MTSVGVRASFTSDVVRRESDIENALALAERGISSVRLRISWADIVPKEDRPADRTVEELAEMVLRLGRGGLGVWPTLCGNRLPGWFLNEGAFADPKATDRHWGLYVDTVASAISDAVTGWIPFESPISLVDEGWRRGVRDPGIVDEAKFADAFGGLVRAYSAVTRMLGQGSALLALDLHHAGATNEVIGVFHEAAMRGRLAIPGRVTREIESLLGGFCGVGITSPDRSSFGTTNDMRRWRDAVAKSTYSIAERFSPLAVSLVASPETTTDAEHEDLVDTLKSLGAEVRDGGAEFAHVWLGDVGRVIGLPADQALSV
jgi:Glycosyl hydrolase family 1